MGPLWFRPCADIAHHPLLLRGLLRSILPQSSNWETRERSTHVCRHLATHNSQGAFQDSNWLAPLQGEVGFLLATDVAARGLDILGVEAVLNYDTPSSLASYLHRIGRTARAGRNGRAVTFIEDSDRALVKEVCTFVLSSGCSDLEEGLNPRAHKNICTFHAANTGKALGVLSATTKQHACARTNDTGQVCLWASSRALELWPAIGRQHSLYGGCSLRMSHSTLQRGSDSKRTLGPPQSCFGAATWQAA